MIRRFISHLQRNHFVRSFFSRCPMRCISRSRPTTNPAIGCAIRRRIISARCRWMSVSASLRALRRVNISKMQMLRRWRIIGIGFACSLGIISQSIIPKFIRASTGARGRKSSAQPGVVAASISRRCVRSSLACIPMQINRQTSIMPRRCAIRSMVLIAPLSSRGRQTGYPLWMGSLCNRYGEEGPSFH